MRREAWHSRTRTRPLYLLVQLLTLTVFVPSKVRAYEYFKDRIPNGENVKDSLGNPWPGVGVGLGEREQGDNTD